MGGFSFANHVKMVSNPGANIRAYTQDCNSTKRHPLPLCNPQLEIPGPSGHDLMYIHFQSPHSQGLFPPHSTPSSRKVRRHSVIVGSPGLSAIHDLEWRGGNGYFSETAAQAAILAVRGNELRADTLYYTTEPSSLLSPWLGVLKKLEVGVHCATAQR